MRSLGRLSPARFQTGAAATPQLPAPKIIVADIKFIGEVHDADAVRARILNGSHGRNWDASNNDWLDELAEVGVRGDFQDHGYFEVNVDGVKSQVVDSTPTQQRVVASSSCDRRRSVSRRRLHFRRIRSVTRPSDSCVRPARTIPSPNRRRSKRR